ncbi:MULTISPECIES: hypothetical protein [Kocuria]|jgi:hypothetical protein|uniref:hypothetical protein n=1 Tax=Kocuria TaxID=57493 RepID=UPI000A7A9F6C|nr:MULTISPECIES: hypothetical protein [Kocuria]NVC23139.1 hypothetical protein [Kocuria salina]
MACSFVGSVEETNRPEPARHVIDSKLPILCDATRKLEDLMKINASRIRDPASLPGLYIGAAG